MGDALERGMVLIFSIWNSDGDFMNWMDSGNAGPCNATEGDPKLILANQPDTHVTWVSSEITGHLLPRISANPVSLSRATSAGETSDLPSPSQALAQALPALSRPRRPLPFPLPQASPLPRLRPRLAPQQSPPLRPRRPQPQSQAPRLSSHRRRHQLRLTPSLLSQLRLTMASAAATNTRAPPNASLPTLARRQTTTTRSACSCLHDLRQMKHSACSSIESISVDLSTYFSLYRDFTIPCQGG